jgi:outer membrane biosynthesis protein TonB
VTPLPPDAAADVDVDATPTQHAVATTDTADAADTAATHRLTEKERCMAKLSTTELLDAFKEMTLLELSDFVKQFEETFEVTAAAPSPSRPPGRRRWRRRCPRRRGAGRVRRHPRGRR